jgi:hypothetical protein
MELSSICPARCCWICGKPVSLENCKVDEHGLAVHEECYLAKVASKSKKSQGIEDLHRRSG